MIKMPMASSSSVNPGAELRRPSVDRLGLVARGRGKRTLLMIGSGGTAVYIIGALHAVRTKGLERIGATVALIEILVAPGIARKFFDVPTLLVVAGKAPSARRTDQGLQPLVGGRVRTVVEIVAIQCLLRLLDVGLSLGALGAVSDAAQAGDDHQGQQPDDQDHNHDLDQG